MLVQVAIGDTEISTGCYGRQGVSKGCYER